MISYLGKKIKHLKFRFVSFTVWLPPQASNIRNFTYMWFPA
jgi:hypothetical protein